MQITKFVHSCLLVKHANRVALFDPGAFSWESGLFYVSKLSRLDDIIITHEHSDHMHAPFIQQLVQTFKDVRITTTPNAAKQLQKLGFHNILTAAHDDITLFTANHESNEPLAVTPQNTGIHYFDKLTHPGDSHHFTETKDILALPINAPWGALTRAAELGIELRPKYVIPVHDWHLSDRARNIIYERLHTFFAQHSISFIKTTNGESFDIANKKA